MTGQFMYKRLYDTRAEGSRVEGGHTKNSKTDGKALPDSIRYEIAARLDYTGAVPEDLVGVILKGDGMMIEITGWQPGSRHFH